MAKYKNGKKVTMYTVLGKIGDFLLWPIMLISLFSSFFMLVQRQQNKVTSVFGFSFVNVLSGSMKDEGFEIRDTVITKQISERDVKLGDIIAFYYQSSTKPVGTTHLIYGYNYSSGKQVDYSEENIKYGNYGDTIAEISANLSQIPKTDTQGAEILKTAQEKNAKIYFHRVIGIYIDDAGTIFYRTKGSNNSTADSPYARGDLLVGRYVHTPQVVRKAVSFCASTTGMIILVCFPLSLLVLMQCMSLIDQVSVISIEKRLISGKIPFEDETVQKDLTGAQMEIYNKVYYYYITPIEKRPVVKEYLWKDLYTTLVLPDKKKQELELVNSSLKLLETSDEAYWNEWINNTKGANHKHLIALRDKCLRTEDAEIVLDEQSTTKTSEETQNNNSEKKVDIENKDNIISKVEVKTKDTENPQPKEIQQKKHKTAPKTVHNNNAKNKRTVHLSHKPKKPVSNDDKK